MNKKIILSLLIILTVSLFSIASAYDKYELNRRLAACRPTKDYDAGGSIAYRITGLMGSDCVFRIINNGVIKKSDLICRVPYSRMREMTSLNPITVQNIKNQYCKIALSKKNITESPNKAKDVYIYY